MPLIVPLNPIANQTVQCSLNGQATTLNVYQQAFGLYMDVLLGTEPVVQGISCLNKTLIVRNAYFGFSGDFCFIDVFGGINPLAPFYTGLGTRFFLTYLLPADVAALGLASGVS
jgi:hypothetical protein